MEKEVLKIFFDFIIKQDLTFNMSVSLTDYRIDFPNRKIKSVEIKKALISLDDAYLEIFLDNDVKFQATVPKINKLHSDEISDMKNVDNVNELISIFFKHKRHKVTFEFETYSSTQHKYLLNKWEFEFFNQ